MVTQQVSHRLIKCQSRFWSQIGTKANGSHHGDNPLLTPAGIQTATKSYATLQVMAPTNAKTVHQTSYYREQPRSTRIVVAYPRPAAFSATERTNYAPTSFDQQVQVSQSHTSYKSRESRNTEVHGGGGLGLVKPAREPASSRSKPCAFLKKPHESCLFAAPCGPRRKKNDRSQTSAFPAGTSRFTPLIITHRGPASPLARRRSSCPPPSPNLVRTHPIEHYQALRDSAPCLSRAATLPKGTKLELVRGVHLGTPSSAQPYRRRVSTDRLNREGSQLAASFEGEPGPTSDRRILPYSYPQTSFRRERARGCCTYYILQ